MRHTSDVKSYDIDMQEDVAEQMVSILKSKEEAPVLKKFLHSVKADLLEDAGGISEATLNAITSLTGHGIIAASRNPYLDEIGKIWSKLGLMTTARAVALNHAYDMSQMTGDLFGCTTAAFHNPTHGMIHCRTLDWPIRSLGKATRIFRFKGKGHEYVTVGMLGFSGALSGMVPGGYSVTINWAPPSGLNLRGISPTFLLREVLETCATYDEAVKKIVSTETLTGAFIMVCGVERGQACVIERTPHAAVVRLPHGVLVHGNHFQVPEFRKLNKATGDEWAQELYEGSRERCANLLSSVKDVKDSDDLDEIVTCLDVDEVLNEDSQQQMLFCPASGEVIVWRKY